MFEYKIDEDVSIRMFKEDDTESFYLLTMESKHYLKEWLGWLNHIQSIEDTLHYIRGALQSSVNYGGIPTNFLILYRGDMAGTIGFNTIDQRNHHASIGYWLGEKFTGKGIMSRAFMAILTYGFETLNLNRIEVRVAEGNMRSRAIPERFGFKAEGILREAELLYGRYVNHVVYSLLNAEWQKRNGGQL